MRNAAPGRDWCGERVQNLEFNNGTMINITNIPISKPHAFKQDQYKTRIK